MTQYPITTEYAFLLIDEAAQENRLYHYNGGQAYIKSSNNPSTLVVIDNTTVNGAYYTESDGSKYFASCAGNNIENSKRLREYGSLLNWYNNTKKVD